MCFTGGMAVNTYQASIEQATGSYLVGTEEWAGVTDLGQAIRAASRLGFALVPGESEFWLVRPGTMATDPREAERLDAEVTTALADEGRWVRQIEQFRITIHGS